MGEKSLNLRFLFSLKSEGTSKVVEWCMNNGLLAKKVECEVCGKDMVLSPRLDSLVKCVWTCRSKSGLNPHSKKVAVQRNSVFERVNLEISTLLLMTYMWANDLTHTFIRIELSLSKQTVTDWISFCRIICLEACDKEKEMIGGLGVEVEIEINKMRDLNKKKYLNGRWVVRGIEKVSKKSFFRIVENPIAIEFCTVFKECIYPGSVIVANWEHYDWCDDASFINATSSYGLTFKDLDKKDKYSGTWGGILKSFQLRKRHIGHDREDLHFAEYIWKKRHAHNRFPSFLSAIRSIYLFPGKTEPTVIKTEVPIALEESSNSIGEQNKITILSVETLGASNVFEDV